MSALMPTEVVFSPVQVFQVHVKITVLQSLSFKHRVPSLQTIIDHVKYWLVRDRKQILYVFSKQLLK